MDISKRSIRIRSSNHQNKSLLTFCEIRTCMADSHAGTFPFWRENVPQIWFWSVVCLEDWENLHSLLRKYNVPSVYNLLQDSWWFATWYSRWVARLFVHCKTWAQILLRERLPTSSHALDTNPFATVNVAKQKWKKLLFCLQLPMYSFLCVLLRHQGSLSVQD